MCVVHYEVVDLTVGRGGVKIALSESMFDNPSRSFLCAPHRLFFTVGYFLGFLPGLPGYSLPVYLSLEIDKRVLFGNMYVAG